MSRFFTVRRYVQGLLALGVVVAVAATAHHTYRAQANARCVSTLKELAAAVRVYVAADEQHRYPDLSPIRGQLTMSPDLFAIWNPHIKYSTGETQNVIDKNYWYLGWIIPNERSGLEWIEQYRAHAPAFDKMDVPDPSIWPDCADDIAARQQLLNEKWHNTHPDGKQLPDESERAFQIGPGLADAKISEVRGYRPMQEGAWRWFSVWVTHTPASSHGYEDNFPVLIERPELHGDGGHVLYMDGHVEFVPYPGEFPMTPRFIEGLRSLSTP